MKKTVFLSGLEQDTMISSEFIVSTMSEKNKGRRDTLIVKQQNWLVDNDDDDDEAIGCHGSPRPNIDDV